MRFGLCEMLLLIKDKDACAKKEDLFGFLTGNSPAFQYKQEDIDLLSAYFNANTFNRASLCAPARSLYELCPEAFDTFVHAWMSELPLEERLLGFGRSIFEAGANKAAKECRRAASIAASNRGSEDTRIVLSAAYKVWHEARRLMGLLRFSPDKKGAYNARCSPDHLTLPALGEFFTKRFGETAWAIIDEKRKLALLRMPGEIWQIKKTSNLHFYDSLDDEWEELWKHYHVTINNESRNNPDLQRQLMPKRYWKYLPEKDILPS